MAALLGTIGGVALNRLRAAGGASHLEDRKAIQAAPAKGETAPSTRTCPAPVKVASLTNVVATDPNDPSYDIQVLRRAGVSAKDVFDSQPAGGRWATSMQNALGKQLVQEVQAVIPEITDLQFLCKHWSCRLAWTPMSDDLNDRVAGLALLTAVSPNIDFGSEPNRKMIFFFYRSPDQFPVDSSARYKEYFDTSQPERYAAGWKKRRQEAYAVFNQGKPTGLSPKYQAAMKGLRLPE